MLWAQPSVSITQACQEVVCGNTIQSVSQIGIELLDVLLFRAVCRSVEDNDRGLRVAVKFSYEDSLSGCWDYTQ